MGTVDYIGFIGVAILLLAYFLQLKNILRNESFLYLFLNFIGASIACLASILLRYVPFVILEGAWSFVSLWGLYKYFTLSSNK